MAPDARENTQGKRVIGTPFKAGNPGRPKGSRSRTTLAVEALLDGQAEALTQKAVEMALAGDMTALRLCFDRIVPIRRDRAVQFALPAIKTAADAVAASGALVAAIAAGELTPSEAAEISRIIEAHTKILEVAEFEERLAKLEARTSQ